MSQNYESIKRLQLALQVSRIKNRAKWLDLRRITPLVSAPQQWRRTSCRPSSGSSPRSRWRSTPYWAAWRRLKSSRDWTAVRRQINWPSRTAGIECERRGEEIKSRHELYVLVTRWEIRAEAALCRSRRQQHSLYLRHDDTRHRSLGRSIWRNVVLVFLKNHLKGPRELLNCSLINQNTNNLFHVVSSLSGTQMLLQVQIFSIGLIDWLSSHLHLLSVYQMNSVQIDYISALGASFVDAALK